MPTRSRKKAVAVGAQALAFGADAAFVIALRLRRIAAGGPAGEAEAKLMVREKLQALADVHRELLSGAYGLTLDSMAKGVARHYSRAVRANRQRLSAARQGR